MNVFDRYFKKYDAWYDKNKFAYLSEINAVKKVLPRRGIGLEIGVGTGRFAAPLGIKFGIDPSSKAISIARKRGVDVRVGAGEKLNFKDSCFDYVAIIIALCFVRNYYKVLSEARRVLRNRGKVIIGIVDKNSLLGRYYRRKKSVFYKEASFFTVKDVTNMLKENGFVRFTYYQTLFDFPRNITSVEVPRKGSGKGSFVVISAIKGVGNTSLEH